MKVVRGHAQLIQLVKVFVRWLITAQLYKVAMYVLAVTLNNFIVHHFIIARSHPHY